MSKAATPPKASGWITRTTIKYATIGAVIAAVIVAVGFANRVSQVAQTPIAQATSLTVGTKAPDFSTPTNAGPFSLAAVNTPVFLEVFATWCPHCQREVPVVDALAKKYAGKVAFIGISGSQYGVDEQSPENQADLDAWVQRLGVTYPIAFDPDLHIANRYLQGGFPTIVVIDRGKTVRYVGSGELPPRTLEKAINGVLSSHS